MPATGGSLGRRLHGPATAALLQRRNQPTASLESANSPLTPPRRQPITAARRAGTAPVGSRSGSTRHSATAAAAAANGPGRKPTGTWEARQQRAAHVAGYSPLRRKMQGPGSHRRRRGAPLHPKQLGGATTTEQGQTSGCASDELEAWGFAVAEGTPREGADRLFPTAAHGSHTGGGRARTPTDRAGPAHSGSASRRVSEAVKARAAARAHVGAQRTLSRALSLPTVPSFAPRNVILHTPAGDALAAVAGDAMGGGNSRSHIPAGQVTGGISPHMDIARAVVAAEWTGVLLDAPHAALQRAGRQRRQAATAAQRTRLVHTSTGIRRSGQPSPSQQGVPTQRQGRLGSTSLSSPLRRKTSTERQRPTLHTRDMSVSTPRTNSPERKQSAARLAALRTAGQRGGAHSLASPLRPSTSLGISRGATAQAMPEAFTPNTRRRDRAWSLHSNAEATSPLDAPAGNAEATSPLDMPGTDRSAGAGESTGTPGDGAKMRSGGLHFEKEVSLGESDASSCASSLPPPTKQMNPPGEQVQAAMYEQSTAPSASTHHDTGSDRSSSKQSDASAQPALDDEPSHSEPRLPRYRMQLPSGHTVMLEGPAAATAAYLSTLSIPALEAAACALPVTAGGTQRLGLLRDSHGGVSGMAVHLPGQGIMRFAAPDEGHFTPSHTTDSSQTLTASSHLTASPQEVARALQEALLQDAAHVAQSASSDKLSFSQRQYRGALLAYVLQQQMARREEEGSNLIWRGGDDRLLDSPFVHPAARAALLRHEKHAASSAGAHSRWALLKQLVLGDKAMQHAQDASLADAQRDLAQSTAKACAASVALLLWLHSLSMDAADADGEEFGLRGAAGQRDGSEGSAGGAAAAAPSWAELMGMQEDTLKSSILQHDMNFMSQGVGWVLHHPLLGGRMQDALEEARGAGGGGGARGGQGLLAGLTTGRRHGGRGGGAAAGVTRAAAASNDRGWKRRCRGCCAPCAALRFGGCAVPAVPPLRPCPDAGCTAQRAVCENAQAAQQRCACNVWLA